MSRVPDDITSIIREIDDELKREGTRPAGRPLQAIMKFGQRFGISMPITPPHSAMSGDLLRGGDYTSQIHRWYEEVYGDHIKIDPSADAKVAVLAHGDLWELKLPIVYGSCVVFVERRLSKTDQSAFRSASMNVCDALSGITQSRLEYFSDADLSEVFNMFDIGMSVRQAFERFGKSSHLFHEAQSDWAAAVMHMTKQNPNFGQARWSSLQLAEKFMKGLIKVIGDVQEIPQTHILKKLHDELAKSVQDLDLEELLIDIQCTAAVRYGEEASTLEQAYSAHKASLILVQTLGSIRSSNALE